VDVKHKTFIKRVQSALPMFLWAMLALPIAAQIPLPKGSKTPPPAQQEEPKDLLGRSAPRGTITEFILAVNRDDFVSAARYMQLTSKQRSNTETLARDLKTLFDRYFKQPVSLISNSPEGTVDDSLPLDREQIGPFKIGEEEFHVELVRIKDKEAGQIWLISSETLARVPEVFAASSSEKTWIERVMPETLLNNAVFGLSLAQIVFWVGSIAIPFLALWLISAIVLILARRIFTSPHRRERVDSWFSRLRWPTIVVLTLSIHLASLSFLGLSLKSRVVYTRIVAAVLVLALAWFIRRLLTLLFDRTRSKIQLRDKAGTRSLLLLGERLLKVAILLVAIFLILTIAGVDPTTSLAGFGIIGVALALGAQKTVENILGGVFLLMDRVLAVGDTCSISNTVGTVEDITLRSVRLRTSEQTLLSIPAGMLSQNGVENFSARRKILSKTTLRLTYGTTTEQLRTVLDGIHGLLAKNPEIETGTARVRLVNFGVGAIEIEVFFYVQTTDYLQFLAVREDLLLQISGVVENSGSSFARPEIVGVTPR
jgi:MscS family membrane protein